MAKVKRSKKLNTDLDDSLIGDVAGIVVDEVVIPEDDATGEGEDLMSYTMGKIEAEDSEDDEAEEFAKAAKNLNANEDDEEAEWVEDEEFNTDDEDSFLDAEDYDSDNPDDDSF